MQTNLQNFSARLSYLMEYKGYSNANEFARAIGYDRSEKIRRIIRYKDKNPSYEILRDIAKKFADINITWLLTGKGNILLSPELSPELSPDDAQENKNNHQTNQPIQPLAITVDQTGHDNIIMVDTKTAASYPQNLYEPEFYKDLPAFTLPGPEFRNAIFRCFEVEGDSMQNTLYHGDWLVCHYIEHHAHIREGHVHIVITQDAVITKRLLNRVDQRGMLVLQSDNSTYPPFQLDINYVQEIWRAKCKMSFILSNVNQDMQDRMRQLESRMVEIENRLNSK